MAKNTSPLAARAAVALGSAVLLVAASVVPGAAAADLPNGPIEGALIPGAMVSWHPSVAVDGAAPLWLLNGEVADDDGDATFTIPEETSGQSLIVQYTLGEDVLFQTQPALVAESRPDLAEALGIDAEVWVSGDPRGVAIDSTPLRLLNGDFVVLSTGDAADVITGGSFDTDLDGNKNFMGHDNVTLNIRIPADRPASCLAFDFVVGTKDPVPTADFTAFVQKVIQGNPYDGFSPVADSFTASATPGLRPGITTGSDPDAPTDGIAHLVVDGVSWPGNTLGIAGGEIPTFNLEDFVTPNSAVPGLAGVSPTFRGELRLADDGNGYLGGGFSVDDVFVDGGDSILALDNLQFFEPGPDCDGTQAGSQGDFTDSITGLETVVGSVPTIDGNAQVGSTLTADAGAWAPEGTHLSYNWLVGGNVVDGANAQTFTVPADAVGKSIEVDVIGELVGPYLSSLGGDFGGTPDAHRSAPTPPVTSAVFTVTPAPTISGTAAVGQKLTASRTAWTARPGTTNPTSYAYQWKLNGSAISGATGATLTMTPAMLNGTITVQLTGSRAEGSTSVSSAAVVVGPGALTPAVPVIAPTSGPPAVGVTLKASSTAWRPTGTVLAWQWLLDGVAVPGAVAKTFVVPVDAVGKSVSVSVTGASDGYTTETRTSASTDAVVNGAFVTKVPKISPATVAVGKTLTATVGAWKPAITPTWEWRIDGGAVAGTSDTFLVPAEALGKTITVTAIGGAPGYDTTSVTSTATASVAPGAFTVKPRPTISGTVRPNESLSVAVGLWNNPAPDQLSVQWFLDGVAQNGETADTFTVPTSAVGKKVTVETTAIKNGYATVTVASVAKTVAVARYTAKPKPVISGAATPGSLLTATTNGWAPEPTSFTYQWYIGATAVTGATGSTFTAPAAGSKVKVTIVPISEGYETIAPISSTVVTIH